MTREEKRQEQEFISLIIQFLAGCKERVKRINEIEKEDKYDLKELRGLC